MSLDTPPGTAIGAPLGAEATAVLAALQPHEPAGIDDPISFLNAAFSSHNRRFSAASTWHWLSNHESAPSAPRLGQGRPSPDSTALRKAVVARASVQSTSMLCSGKLLGTVLTAALLGAAPDTS